MAKISINVRYKNETDLRESLNWSNEVPVPAALVRRLMKKTQWELINKSSAGDVLNVNGYGFRFNQVRLTFGSCSVSVLVKKINPP